MRLSGLVSSRPDLARAGRHLEGLAQEGNPKPSAT
jgi:hypothetical protein